MTGVPTCACKRPLSAQDIKRGLHQCIHCALKGAHLPKTGSLWEKLVEDAKWERDEDPRTEDE